MNFKIIFNFFDLEQRGFFVLNISLVQVLFDFVWFLEQEDIYEIEKKKIYNIYIRDERNYFFQFVLLLIFFSKEMF